MAQVKTIQPRKTLTERVKEADQKRGFMGKAFKLPIAFCKELRALSDETGVYQWQIVTQGVAMWKKRYEKQRKKATPHTPENLAP